MKSTNSTSLLSLCALLPLLAAFSAWVSAQTTLAPTSTAVPAPHPFESAILAFEAEDKKNPPPQHAILFAGDSAYTRWKTIHEDLKGYTVINRGFGGSQMSDLLYYMDRIVVPYHPRLIIVHEAGNDIHQHKSPEQFMSEVKAFVAHIQALLPGVPIAFECTGPNPARWNETPTKIIYNRLLKDYIATQKNITFVDFFNAVLGPDGKPLPEFFDTDLLHPSELGYQLRVKALLPILGPPDKK